MNRFYSFMIAALAASVLFSCQEKPLPEPDPEYVLTVKTGRADVDETDVVLNGSYTYDGPDAVNVGLRYAADKSALASAELINCVADESGKFSTEVKGLANGEYYYQAVASVGDKEPVCGAEGFFKVDFSLVPTIVTGVADITDAGYVLKGEYAFSSKKVAIKVGFRYAATAEAIASAEFVEVAPEETGSFSTVVPLSFGASCFYQAVAVVEGTEYKGEVKSAGMTDLSVNGIANCYIVKETGWYMFPAKKADGSVAAGNSAGWIWATGTDKNLVSNVAYSDGVISFKVEKYAQASVVIALYNGDTCVWTWHIWMSDVAPQTLGTTTFLDRNLGAIAKSADEPGSIGLMYQFGRKDPFIGTNMMDKTIATNLYESTAFSLDRTLDRPWCADYVVNTDYKDNKFSHAAGEFDQAKADANPMTHMGGYNTGGWSLSNEQIKDFWGGVSGSKQMNDPCPAGYKVPVLADYVAFINNVLLNSTSGTTSRYGVTADGKQTWGRVYTLDGVLYDWPATGWRAWSGVIARPGNVIALNTASVTDGTEHSMQIYWNWGNTPGKNWMVEAFPLRCVMIK